jgi:hypothetical protein
MAGTNPVVKKDDNWLGEEGSKLPSTLNVLTILTFIANGLSFIWAFVTYARAQASYEMAVNNQDKLDAAPAWARKLAGPHPVETARAALDNKLPLLIIALLVAALCFFGALQMRQLKKVGFSLYVLGDIVGFSIGIFIGFDVFTGFFVVIAVLIEVLFIILYATQLKFMK